MSADLIADMERYRDVITAADVRCVLDARDVNPPAVLIRPPSVSYRFGRGCVGASWTAWLYLPDAGQIDALRVGFPIVDAVHTALAHAGVAILSAEPGDFALPDGGTVPGFVITWNTSQ
jgi:hypothetical protein